MPLDRRDIVRSLKRKGFVLREGGRHMVFHHELDGVQTGPQTILSRGTGSSEVNDHLVGQMARQLKLKPGEFRDLVACTLSADGYVQILKEKGLLEP